MQVDAAGHYRHDEDVTIAFLPFFHIYGLVVIGLLGLWSGATLVLMPRFDLESYLGLVERHRATMLHVVPPVVVALAKHPAVDQHTADIGHADAIPKSPSGKILRRLLREIAMT